MNADTENQSNDSDDDTGNECECLCPWMEYCNLGSNKQDLLINVSLVLISIGLAVSCVGIIIPRDYVFDASLPAREMENIAMHYASLSYYLDVCVVIGMAFITAGIMVASGLTVYHYVTTRRRIYREQDRRDLNLLNRTQSEMVSYGSSDVR